jgi:hypothetical protein
MGKTNRQRAKELQAEDAKELIKASLPEVFKIMSPAQIDQAQKVLDAVVVNPALEKEANDLYRKSVIAKSGNYANRDPKLVQQADDIMNSRISVTEADKRIRLEYQKLITDDAMKLKTDNPDEQRYWEKVKNTLESKGVWLRLGQEYKRSKDDPSQHYLDPRDWVVFLSLGADGETIPTKTGVLDQAALLGTKVLGARYYEDVAQGNIQKTLQKAIDSIRRQIEDGLNEHQLLYHDRYQAPVVSGISDTLGGADLPDEDMWNDPRDLLKQALSANVNGNVKRPSKILVLAAIETANCAQALAEYMEARYKGANRAVKILRALDYAGKVAGVILIVYGVFTVAVRLLASEAVAAGTGTGADVWTTTRTGGAVGRGQVSWEGQYYRTHYVGREAFKRTLQAAEGAIERNEGAAAAQRTHPAPRALRPQPTGRT